MSSNPALLEPVHVSRPGCRWTLAEFERLPDDGKHNELVRGDLLVSRPTSPSHGLYASRLSFALGTWAEQKSLGDVYLSAGFLLHPEPEAVVRAPDIAFVRGERVPPVEQQEGFWPLAPDLAAEVISFSDGAAELQAKVKDYLDAGVRLVWLVYPKIATVVEYRAGGLVHQYQGDTALDGRDVLPGFSYRLASLFK